MNLKTYYCLNALWVYIDRLHAWLLNGISIQKMLCNSYIGFLETELERKFRIDVRLQNATDTLTEVLFK